VHHAVTEDVSDLQTKRNRLTAEIAAKQKQVASQPMSGDVARSLILDREEVRATYWCLQKELFPERKTTGPATR
jgi:hypothetical protein